MKKTPWFTGQVNPVRPGVYQRDYRQAKNCDRVVGIAFNHWDGKKWSLFDSTANGAERSEELWSSHQDLPWRGLASNPAAKEKANGR